MLAHEIITLFAYVTINRLYLLSKLADCSELTPKPVFP
jgi:hypothetical protein